ncbi:molybdate ABC transporter substrate-binding protein [Arsenicicoccus dermatophilus]|uniref:molybdate ABC transporter substrate-binding protein n=1 Tax=Arsenicicoccus dermatophilus TaxID=1076331 RepID=UPI001F4CE25B|nr:molybdate ABC transporter substrate-binding protein [Arsenicicoccus dermatophilus]MCH8614286.1 molybdate ABC transporter substrate-binding protein [Arsenicicoccus dermatophilus]
MPKHHRTCPPVRRRTRRPAVSLRAVPLAVAASLGLSGCLGVSGEGSAPPGATPGLSNGTASQAGSSQGASPAGGSTGGATSAQAARPGDARTVTVLAAASLERAFTRLGQDFERTHPGVRVRFSFAGSSDLVAQLEQGAPADVLATADERTMGKAVAGSLVSGVPTPFATNTLTIVTAPGNPRGVTSLADLAKDGTQVVVCAPQVPCGAAATAVQHAAGVTLDPVSEEQSVTDVLGKVTSGQADAGLVYRTDAAGAGGAVAGVPFPEAATAVNVYPIAVTAASKGSGDAAAFVDLVRGPTGRAVLTQLGFQSP